MRIFQAILFLFILYSGLASATQINAVRMWTGPDGTRVVFDLDRRVLHKVFVLREPDRIVVDLQDTRFTTPLSDLDYSKSLVKGIRSAKRNANDLRVVFDVSAAVNPKSFILNPTQQYGYRLVLDLEPRVAVEVADQVSIQSRLNNNNVRDVVIAVDAGHGGEDPGAVGRRGTQEKAVVLAIAKKLAQLINREPGMKAVLIRSGDYYVSLRERIRKARRYKADLFVSVHADAFRNRKAKGASVYALSKKGASSEAARWLAARENAADLIGGVSLDDKDGLLASVLLDLSQNATIAASMDIGDDVLGELGRIGHLHKDKVEHAGFVVLKSPDIPSILVETGFISNRQEENLLRSNRHQQRLAQAMLRGIRSYFRNTPLPGTLFAQKSPDVNRVAGVREHVVARGDTLISIARRYQVSPHRLRTANGINGDAIQAGHTLVIP